MYQHFTDAAQNLKFNISKNPNFYRITYVVCTYNCYKSQPKWIVTLKERQNAPSKLVQIVEKINAL